MGGFSYVRIKQLHSMREIYVTSCALYHIVFADTQYTIPALLNAP